MLINAPECPLLRKKAHQTPAAQAQCHPPCLQIFVQTQPTKLQSHPEFRDFLRVIE